MQAALLRVALDDRPEAAVRSWQELRPSLDVEILEPGSFELMPLVYRNLTGAGVDDPELGRIEGHRSKDLGQKQPARRADQGGEQRPWRRATCRRFSSKA